MTFIGFYYIREWDGTTSRVSVKEERADMYDWLTKGVSFWYHICYEDGVVHILPDYAWEGQRAGTFDPNVYVNGVPH